MGMHGMKKMPVKKMYGGTGKKKTMGGTKAKPGAGLFMMAPGGKMKKATKAEIAKAMGMGGTKKPNPGAVRMAKGILKKAGMKAVPMSYGGAAMRKKKKK